MTLSTVFMDAESCDDALKIWKQMRKKKNLGCSWVQNVQ